MSTPCISTEILWFIVPSRILFTAFPVRWYLVSVFHYIMNFGRFFMRRPIRTSVCLLVTLVLGASQTEQFTDSDIERYR